MADSGANLSYTAKKTHCLVGTLLKVASTVQTRLLA